MFAGFPCSTVLVCCCSSAVVNGMAVGCPALTVRLLLKVPLAATVNRYAVNKRVCQRTAHMCTSLIQKVIGAECGLYGTD